MLRVVVVVQQVMKRTGMLGMRAQHLLENRPDLCLRGATRQHLTVAFVRIDVADEAARHRAQKSERVQRRHIGIVRLAFMEPSHLVRVPLMSNQRVAVGEEHLHGREEPLVPGSRGLRDADRRRRTETCQRLASRRDILAPP